VRFIAAAMGAVLAATGCASVVGLDFDAYGEGPSTVDGGEQTQCVPRSTVRCLCELSEGIQTCSEGGRLSPCECRDASAQPGGPSCGNGVVEVGEACDDKNTTSGDGCSSLCVPDGRPPEVESCPGQPVSVSRGRTVRMDLATFVRGAGDTIGTCGFLAKPERIYAITPVMAGELVIALTSDAPLSFSVRTTCASANAPVSCDAVPAGTTISRKIRVQLGETYFLVIEPNQASPQATYSISLEGS
jgi:cysteine-rich repeat protein